MGQAHDLVNDTKQGLKPKTDTNPNKLIYRNPKPIIRAQQTPSSSSVHPRQSRMKKDPSSYLLPYGTSLIINTLPLGVEPVQHKCILEPEHGIFYQDAQGNMCFQRTIEIPNSPTQHLYHLRLACMGHKHIGLGFHGLISIALAERLPELRQDEYIWVKPEIEEEAEVRRNLVI